MVLGIDKLKGRDKIEEKVLGDEEVKGLRDREVVGSSLKIMKPPINIFLQVFA